MRALKLIVPSVLLTAGFLVCTTASYGTPEYMKKEKKACTFCHSGKIEPANKEAMQKSLNDAGKYYKEHNHSFDGYTPKK